MRVQQSPPHIASLTECIWLSTGLAEPIFKFREEAAPQSADGDLVLP